MLIDNGDGTMLGGPLDVICILRNVGVDPNTYHVAFLEERPFPGALQSPEDTKLVRLACKLSRTEGRSTLEEAEKDFLELSEQIRLPDTNLWTQVMEWDGEMGPVWVVNNWLGQ